jgi:protein-disulfide isomerase
MSARQRQREIAARRRTNRAVFIVGVAAAAAALAVAVIHWSTATPPAPPPGRQPAATTGGTTMGNAAARVTIEVFSDFLCSHCADFAAQVEPAIIADYVKPGTVRLVYRHFPIVDERFSVTAAAASECAADQQQFWAYHDELFALASRSALRTRGDLEGAAAKIGLDQAAFAQCVRRGATRGRVDTDFAEGKRRGVSGTPTSFINGEPVAGAQPIEVFRGAIETALKR